MVKHKFFWLSLVIVLAGALIVYFACTILARQTKQTGQRPVEATVFFHGYGSSRRAEASMSQSLVQVGYSNRRIDVTVGQNGTVTMNQKISAGDKNPLILVQFDNNKNQNFDQTAGWVRTIMTKLKQEGIQSVNLIGHSMGNMAISYYLMNVANQDNQLPKVNRQISIAGTYNGLMMDPQSQSALDSTGAPQTKLAIFNQLQGLLAYYQSHTTKVLNIYGNSTGKTESDTTVYNNSSKALKYFVRQPSTYQEKLITGADGQHSKLHENKTVDQAILAFLES